MDPRHGGIFIVIGKRTGMEKGIQSYFLISPIFSLPFIFYSQASPSQDRRHNKKEHNKKELNVILHVKVWETDTTAART